MFRSYRYSPSAPLSAYVDCFWYRQGEIPDRRREYSMPTGSADLVVNLDGDRIRVFSSASDVSGIIAREAVIHGPQSRSFVIDDLKRVHFIGIHFRPGGTYLLGAPALEFTDQHVSLGEVWGSEASRLRERLMECVSHKQMFALLEIESLKRLQFARVVHPAISFALKSFRSGEPLPRVAHVQRETGYAERRFTEMFKHTVGLTPKRYARVLRLKAALKDISQRTRSLADVAASNGYFDQAHLANECREIAGFTPSEYKPVARSLLHMEVIDRSD
jgi:AraC-like DNA-binding protein